jgi:uncharacterized phiE125 gp8 family phage protein
MKTLIEPPEGPPITVAEVRSRLVYPETGDGDFDAADDATILGMIYAATDRVEHETGRTLVEQQWEATFGTFSAYCDARLPIPSFPVLSIVSVKYTDGNGAEQTVSSGDYVLRAGGPGYYVRPAYGLAWPGARADDDAVRVRYRAGHSDVALIPAGLLQALFLIVGDLWRHRDTVSFSPAAEIPMSATVKSLLAPYRVWL